MKIPSRRWQIERPSTAPLYGRRTKTCRFSFPKPPSSKTLITKDDPEHGNKLELAVLGKVQKLIVHGNTDLILAELLGKAEVTEKYY